MGDVCQRLRAATHTYNQYALDLTSIAKPGFHRLFALIHREGVTALTLCDRGSTPRQIDLFRRIGHHLHLFTRLRSLTLLNIDRKDLHYFLRHVSGCSLTSLALRSTIHNQRAMEQIVQRLSSIIGQPTFLRLRLLNRSLCELIDQLQWPIECKLRSLTMEFYTEKRSLDVLRHASNLETLELGKRIESASNELESTENSLVPPHRRLTSLILSNCSLSMYEMQTLLSLTPSLIHLRIISTDHSIISGSRWYDLIETRLSALTKFEFYIQWSLQRHGDALQSRLTSFMASFCTLFWTTEKRWPITYNWFPNHTTGEIYTLPICKLNYVHRADPNILTASNFVREVPRSTSISEFVVQLLVTPYKSSSWGDRVSRSCSTIEEFH